MDGIRCRIDAVDFAADEVRLTNIEDKNRPIRFSESIQYVRSYVEEAGTAIYDTIPKKPVARESIRDKLKSVQKAQSPHTPKPQKSKGKDMVLWYEILYRGRNQSHVLLQHVQPDAADSLNLIQTLRASVDARMGVGWGSFFVSELQFFLDNTSLIHSLRINISV